MKKQPHDWSPILAAERPVERFPSHGRYRLALAYANTYHVGMSSLGFQRVYELVHRRPEWACERFFSDGVGMPVSLETRRPLNDFGCITFSVSFEEDYVNLLQMLDRARIPLRRRDRGPWDPVIVMGGSCASINPLPMSEFVDVFALGAAENVLPVLLAALEEEDDREAVIERLAAHDGFYVPAFHRPEEGGDELAQAQQAGAHRGADEAAGVPADDGDRHPATRSSREKFLIEMSPRLPREVPLLLGHLRHGPLPLASRPSTSWPRWSAPGRSPTSSASWPRPWATIRTSRRSCAQANELGFRTSVSSIRIPAVTEGVLDALHASGDRSITLAPETGTDALRVKMGKPIPNSFLLEKIRLIFRHGFTQLKLYFIVGLPGETMEDVQGILDLAAQARAIMLEELPKRGLIGNVHLGVNVLVPKPYTPWQREPMDDEKSLKEKIALLRKGVARMPNVSHGLGLRPPVDLADLHQQGRQRRGRRHRGGGPGRVDLAAPPPLRPPDPPGGLQPPGGRPPLALHAPGLAAGSRFYR